MTETEKAYVAGIIDGEGCITILKRKPRERRKSYSYTLNVIVLMTSEKVVNYIRGLVEGSRIYYCVKQNSKHSNTYRFVITQGKAIELLKDIRPYLVEKQRQADIGIAFSGMIINKGAKPSDELSEQREAVYQEIMSLHL